MAVTARSRSARERRWPAALTWSLWALIMLSLAVIWWLDSLARQAGRLDMAR
jgi:hypothetical protein